MDYESLFGAQRLCCTNNVDFKNLEDAPECTLMCVSDKNGRGDKGSIK